MSLIFLTHHNEFIQDMKEPDKIIKPKKYTSTNKKRVEFELLPAVKYDEKINKRILQTTSKHYSHKTMGYPEVPLSNPCDFLKKNRGVRFQKIPNHKCLSKDSPPVPRRSDQYIFAHDKKKNFQQLNKEMIHNLKPKQPKPKVALTRYGSTYELCNSGVIPSNIYSSNFGKTPKYMEKIKNTLKEKQLKEIEKQKPDLSLPEGIRCLSNKERFKILDGLRKKWLETTLQFNTMPSIVDTIPLKLRKHATEEYLRQLERDLLLLESSPLIYICDNDLQKFFLTHHNEYIQDITNEYEDTVHHPAKYKSQHKDTPVKPKKNENLEHPNIIIPSESGYALHRTMGYAETPIPDPCNFLRKNSGIRFCRTPQHKCCNKYPPFPPLPRISELQNKTEIKPTKNFKKINIKKVENATVKRPLPKVATTITGDTKLLCNAGILPAYIYSPNFGKVPEYLKKVKECREICKHFVPRGGSRNTPLFTLPEGKYDKKQLQKFTKQMLKLQKQKIEEQKKRADKTYSRPFPQLPPNISMVPEEVRKEMIAGLKKNFIEIMENYQKGPVYVDTIPKKQRRTKIENELRQIEDDVLLLEFNPVIYVCNSENKNE